MPGTDSLHILQGEIDQALHLVDLVHHRDVGVVDRGLGTGFVHQAPAPFRIGDELGREELVVEGCYVSARLPSAVMTEVLV